VIVGNLGILGLSFRNLSFKYCQFIIGSKELGFPLSKNGILSLEFRLKFFKFLTWNKSSGNLVRRWLQEFIVKGGDILSSLCAGIGLCDPIEEMEEFLRGIQCIILLNLLLGMGCNIANLLDNLRVMSSDSCG